MAEGCKIRSVFCQTHDHLVGNLKVKGNQKMTKN